jgi:hypothetical protein
MDKTPSLFARIYYFLTSFLDTNLTELFAGISIGIAINLTTEQDIPFLMVLAIVFLSVSVIFQLILIRIRQKIDKSFESRKELEMTPEDKWMASAGYDNKFRVGLFFLSIIFALASFGSGIKFIYDSKRIADTSAETQLKEQSERIINLKEQSERIIKLNADLIAIQGEMKKSTDSILTILREKTVLKK